MPQLTNEQIRKELLTFNGVELQYETQTWLYFLSEETEIKNISKTLGKRVQRVVRNEYRISLNR